MVVPELEVEHPMSSVRVLLSQPIAIAITIVHDIRHKLQYLVLSTAT